MKQNEIISRQNRVVYILLVIVGSLGLAWAIWRHWYLATEAPAARSHVSHSAVRPASQPWGASRAA